MSRIGKQIINIPEKTAVTKNGAVLTVKGPLGELSREFKDYVDIIITDDSISFAPKEETPFTNALWGTYASHVKNMVDGVNKQYEKKLVVEGIGFKVELKGGELVFALGFSHPVTQKIPEGINVNVEKNTITVSGIDKDAVGRFAAEIKALKKPEPYKGKGIRYEGEIIRRKQGKKTV